MLKEDVIVVVDSLDGVNTERGYFSYINQAINGLSTYYDRKTKIYIDFRSMCNGFVDVSGENMFEYIFEQPFIECLDESKHNIIETNIWISGTSIKHHINKTCTYDIELGGKTFKDFLKIREDILQEFNDMFDMYKDYKILGVHKRGTDHDIHGKLIHINSYIDKVKELEEGYDKIFLATDEVSTLKVFKEEFKDKLIYLNCERSNTELPLFKQDLPYTKQEHIKEVFFDSFFLSKCHFLIKTYSNITNFSIFANPSMPFEDIDTGIKYV